MFFRERKLTNGVVVCKNHHLFKFEYIDEIKDVGGRRQGEIITLGWLDINDKARSNRSPSLHSTLAELDEKTKAMLKLIEQDAESFSQRAEIYYNKRPKLINMVQDFYRIHCSLAESYDQLMKFESGLSFTKDRLRKSLSLQENTFHSYSDGYKFVEFDESEVDDPEEEAVVEEEELSDSGKEEWTRLQEELERLREENKAQREELMQKDEEKRDVIRQLSLAMDLVMEENLEMEKCLQ